jgi:mannosyltransferase
VEKAGLAGRILFVGEHRDIERWYRALSLYIAPQRWEGFGLTPLEAMASGVPVVASDVGAFSELIEDGVTGTLIARDDLGAMMGAAGRLMGDDKAREGAAAASLQRAHKLFPLQREAETLIGIYRRLQAGTSS